MTLGLGIRIEGYRRVGFWSQRVLGNQGAEEGFEMAGVDDENKLTGLVIGAAISVHRELGPGKKRPLMKGR